MYGEAEITLNLSRDEKREVEGGGHCTLLGPGQKGVGDLDSQHSLWGTGTCVQVGLGHRPVKGEKKRLQQPPHQGCHLEVLQPLQVGGGDRGRLMLHAQNEKPSQAVICLQDLLYPQCHNIAEKPRQGLIPCWGWVDKPKTNQG